MEIFVLESPDLIKSLFETFMFVCRTDVCLLRVYLSFRQTKQIFLLCQTLNPNHLTFFSLCLKFKEEETRYTSSRSKLFPMLKITCWVTTLLPLYPPRGYNFWGYFEYSFNWSFNSVILWHLIFGGRKKDKSNNVNPQCLRQRWPILNGVAENAAAKAFVFEELSGKYSRGVHHRNK